jgi:hypothetical protein
MRLITRFELATRSSDELHRLYRDIFNRLARTDANTPSRRNALASLENIQRELAQLGRLPSLIDGQRCQIFGSLVRGTRRREGRLSLPAKDRSRKAETR